MTGSFPAQDSQNLLFSVILGSVELSGGTAWLWNIQKKKGTVLQGNDHLTVPVTIRAAEAD